MKKSAIRTIRDTLIRIGIYSVLLFAVSLSPAFASDSNEKHNQDIAGIWEGVLRHTGIELRVVFHISRNPDGVLTAVMDSPNQNAEGIPVSKVTLKDSNLRMEVMAVQGIFEGIFKENVIAGKWVQSGQSFALMLRRTAQAAALQQPSEVLPDNLQKRDVWVGRDEWKVPGTLLLPSGGGPFRAIILVHGSGPHDQDETIGENKPFRDLARGLASRGIAVLRYEKRTRHHTAKFAALKNITVNEETIQDCLAAVSFLRDTREIDDKKIFVLGHSLGGMLIPRIGKLEPDIAGFIMLAGSTLPLEDAIISQINCLFSIDGNISESEKAQLSQLKEQAARVKSPDLSVNTHPNLLPLGIPASYWLDLRGYNPPELAKILSQPMLILQGERDYQVTMDDFQGWKKSLSDRKNVAFKLYPNLNHLFIEGKGKSTPAEYLNPGHMSASVINDIADWVLAVGD